MGQISEQSKRIRILYADDRPDNIRSLLEGVIMAGLLPNTQSKKISLEGLHHDAQLQNNHDILHDPTSLVELDYSTLVEEAINKVQSTEVPYDLIISDWYFGDGDDPAFKNSQVGGIWIVLWAQSKYRNYKPICKLYTGLQTHTQQGVDFKLAKKYIKSVFGVELKVVPKSETGKSWRDHLTEYLLECAQNIVNQISTAGIVDVINYIGQRLSYDIFNNTIQDNQFDDFYNDLIALGGMRLQMINSQLMELNHLFPFQLGRYLLKGGPYQISIDSPKNIETILYGSRRLVFHERDEKDEKLEQLKKSGIECIEKREYDPSDEPLYIIEITSSYYVNGVLAEITNLFKQSLDFSYKVQTFYLNEQGLGKWLHSRNIKLGEEGFNSIRDITVLPEFESIKACFKKTPVKLQHDLPSYGQQIQEMLESINEGDLKHEEPNEVLLKNYTKLQKQPLFDKESRQILVPIKSIFRINVLKFLLDVLKLVPATKARINYGIKFQEITTPDFYWYCNAWLVREGLRTIVNNMNGTYKYFTILKPSNISELDVVSYKIVLKDTGKGLSSISRVFSGAQGYFSNVGNFLQGFCELRVLSKMDDLEAIEYNPFLDVNDKPCSEIIETGTQFEITVTQKRDR